MFDLDYIINILYKNLSNTGDSRTEFMKNRIKKINDFNNKYFSSLTDLNKSDLEVLYIAFDTLLMFYGDEYLDRIASLLSNNSELLPAYAKLLSVENQDTNTNLNLNSKSNNIQRIYDPFILDLHFGPFAGKYEFDYTGTIFEDYIFKIIPANFKIVLLKYEATKKVKIIRSNKIYLHEFIQELANADPLVITDKSFINEIIKEENKFLDKNLLLIDN